MVRDGQSVVASAASQSMSFFTGDDRFIAMVLLICGRDIFDP